MDSGSLSPLLVLPNELQLAVIEYLRQPRDVLHLGRTCKALHAITTSDDVWRARVESLVRHQMRTSHSNPASLTSWQAGTSDIYKTFVDRLLGKGAKYLGWWGSTQPYRGRLIRISIDVRHEENAGVSDDDPGPQLAIVAEEVSCVNAFDMESRRLDASAPPRWKPAAAHWHNAGRISYRLPINHLSPHAGLSVDVLYPILHFNPIFTLTSNHGFTLVSRHDNGKFTTGLPISVPMDLRHRRKLEDISGTSEHPPSRYSMETGPCFPGHDAFSAGILRNVNAWDIGLTTENGDASRYASDARDMIDLQGEVLTAPVFTLKAVRAEAPADEVASTSSSASGVNQPRHGGSNMDYIYQTRTIPSPPPQPPILLSNPGGNQLFRAFLEGIGAALPQQMHDALFDEPADQDPQEYFYPISRCPMPDDRIIPRPLSKPVLASSLEGLWVGCYSTHGYEFGIINVRNAWLPTRATEESSVIEQFYAEQRFQDGNAVPSVTREPLAPNLAGSTKVLRTIIELVKVTGDVNVPAGQVSWCAVLPRAFDDDDTSSSDSSSASDVIMEEVTDTDLNIDDVSTIELPTVKRSDWEQWSDAPPHTAEEHHSLANPPRWDEGSLEAAGRIAYTGFIDTRFIDAIATFVREDNGQVDEIRITWAKFPASAVATSIEMAHCRITFLESATTPEYAELGQ